MPNDLSKDAWNRTDRRIWQLRSSPILNWPPDRLGAVSAEQNKEWIELHRHLALEIQAARRGSTRHAMGQKNISEAELTVEKFPDHTSGGAWSGVPRSAGIRHRARRRCPVVDPHNGSLQALWEASICHQLPENGFNGMTEVFARDVSVGDLTALYRQNPGVPVPGAQRAYTPRGQHAWAIDWLAGGCMGSGFFREHTLSRIGQPSLATRKGRRP